MFREISVGNLNPRTAFVHTLGHVRLQNRFFRFIVLYPIHTHRDKFSVRVIVTVPQQLIFKRIDRLTWYRMVTKMQLMVSHRFHIVFFQVEVRHKHF